MLITAGSNATALPAAASSAGSRVTIQNTHPTKAFWFGYKADISCSGPNTGIKIDAGDDVTLDVGSGAAGTVYVVSVDGDVNVAVVWR